MNLLRALSASLIVASLFLVACGDSVEEASNEPKASPAAATKAIDLSKDDLGRTVTVPASARRVVAMSPSVVELMYQVGAAPVGRPSSADYPEAAKSIPSFGTSYQPNYEEIVAMKPDLIIADALIQGDSIDQLTKLGAPVFAIRVASFDDVTRTLRVVGALTGNKEAGEREAKTLEDKLASITAKLPSQQPNVLVVVGAGPSQVFAARSDSYVGDLVKRLGGKNLVTSEPETFRLPGFSEYSLERIVEKNPDVLLALSPGPVNGTTQALGRSPVWSSLKAVKEGRVTEIDPVVYLQAAGPRVSKILDELPRILYPSVFAQAR